VARATPARAALSAGSPVRAYQFDESKNRNYVAVVAAAKAGLLGGIKGLENFAKSQQDDHDNVQPRIGGVFDLRGDGKDVVRAGWGIYASGPARASARYSSLALPTA
jgi:hypothetical protein